MKDTCKTIANLVKENGVVNGVALALVYQNVNSASTWVYHQPAAPKAADKFKKYHA